MTTDAERARTSASYSQETVDALPFNTPEKTDRYRTERFLGGIGLNWYECDPTLQRGMRYYLSQREMDWAEPRLMRLGALMGGPVAERAEITDKNPPQLVKYDRWGHDISEVTIPESARATKEDLVRDGFMGPDFRREAEAAGVNPGPLSLAASYMLNQAEIGMSCAMGADAGMVEAQVARFAPPDIQQLVLPKIASGEWVGATGQFFTERTGGSDLGGLETTATPNGDSWLLNGFKWFASNLDGEAFVVLAKPEGAVDGVKGITPFLVLKYRRDGSRNGMKIRQLKDKLGTKAVASGEVEFVDAEAFMLSGPVDNTSGGASDGKGMARLMSMTNVARLGVAMMGLGCARRALVESLCYSRARASWKTQLVKQPLMKRKLAEMIVDVEAVQALLFEGYGYPNQQRPDKAFERSRLVAPLAKLKAARLGITAASDAIEVHGGNGYVETWPVARILRDAQINTLWEGPDNILCLDVRRAMVRENAQEPFLARIQEAIANAGEAIPSARVVEERAKDLREAIEAWASLEGETQEARLYPLAQFMAEVFTGAVLAERAEWEMREFGDERKSMIASLYTERYLMDADTLRGIGAPASIAMSRFDELVEGALSDDRRR